MTTLVYGFPCVWGSEYVNPPATPVVIGFLEQEDGFFLLQEDGSKIEITAG